MQQVLLVVHLIVALLLIGIIMLQRSEGGALGIGGGSGSLFSSRGVASGLTRTTAILAACFFATSVALTMLANKKSGGSIMDQSPITQQLPAAAGGTAPATPDAGGGSLLPKLDTSKPLVPTN